MPRKTFHFEPYFEKDSQELLELYLQATATVELLRGILAEEGVDASWCDALLKTWDLTIVRLIRHPTPTQIGPN